MAEYMDIISNQLTPWVIEITMYSVIVTVCLGYLIFRRYSKKERFMEWKRDTLNLHIFKREYERNDDWLQNELFTENQKLQNELKVLKKQHQKLSIWAFVAYIFLIFTSYFRDSEEPVKKN